MQDGSQYSVLLIITDGVISDMAQTKEAIVNVSRGWGGGSGNPGVCLPPLLGRPWLLLSRASLGPLPAPHHRVWRASSRVWGVEGCWLMKDLAGELCTHLHHTG